MKSSRRTGSVISIAVVDTGPLVAVANRADPDHQICLEALQSSEYGLAIPALCIAEATYLIGKKKGPTVESMFLRGLEAFDVQAPVSEDWPRIAEIVEEYADFPLGGTDASVIALAERYNSEIIITLDRRHFGAVRPRHRERFRLLP
jgi:hypothetical protein